MEKHFELTEEFKVNVFCVKLFRIKATKDFKEIKKGDLGGFVEKLENVSDDAWVSDDARVYGNARVFGNARVSDDAWVSDDARVFGNARVYDDNHLFWISKIGSVNRTTTFFKCKDGKVRVKCGCFFGDLLDFKLKVTKTHSGTKFEKEYLTLIELAKIKFQINE